MKQPVTFRLDRDLLEKARRTAAAENRTLTNFVETVLKRSIEAPNPAGGRPAGRPSAASGKS
jgi:hypothetical protein